MSFSSQLFTGFSVHPIFQKKQFFIKVVDAGTVVLFVFCERFMFFGFYIRIVNLSSHVSSVGETPGYAYGSYGVKPVCILDRFAFRRIKLILDAGPFERYVLDNTADVRNNLIFYAQALAIMAPTESSPLSWNFQSAIS